MKNKEIVEVKQTNPAESLIAQAIEKGTSVDVMERLLAMRTQLKKEFAKEQFDIAMSKFQGKCPVIKKQKAGGQTKSGQIAYYYAPLDSIIEQTKDLIQEHGFSYSIQTQTLDGKVKVTCTVKHEAGHSESSDIEVPLGAQTGIMSASQVVASALTFAKRYAFCNAFGILTGDDDNDSQKSDETPVEEKMKIALQIIAKETDINKMRSYNEKVQKSKSYTEDQKLTINDAVNSRIDELK